MAATDAWSPMVSSKGVLKYTALTLPHHFATNQNPKKPVPLSALQDTLTAEQMEGTTQQTHADKHARMDNQTDQSSAP